MEHPGVWHRARGIAELGLDGCGLRSGAVCVRGQCITGICSGSDEWGRLQHDLLKVTKPGGGFGGVAGTRQHAELFLHVAWPECELHL